MALPGRRSQMGLASWQVSRYKGRDSPRVCPSEATGIVWDGWIGQEGNPGRKACRASGLIQESWPDLAYLPLHGQKPPLDVEPLSSSFHRVLKIYPFLSFMGCSNRVGGHKTGSEEGVATFQAYWALFFETFPRRGVRRASGSS